MEGKEDSEGRERGLCRKRKRTPEEEKEDLGGKERGLWRKRKRTGVGGGVSISHVCLSLEVLGISELRCWESFTLILSCYSLITRMTSFSNVF